MLRAKLLVQAPGDAGVRAQERAPRLEAWVAVVILGREFEDDPLVLVVAQPTRGLDVGAIEFVHRRLVEQRDAGKAVLLVSLELEEILSLSDRILEIGCGKGEFLLGLCERAGGLAEISPQPVAVAVVEGERLIGMTSAPTRSLSHSIATKPGFTSRRLLCFFLCHGSGK